MCTEKKKSRKKNGRPKINKLIKVDEQLLKAMSYIVVYPCAPEMLWCSQMVDISWYTVIAGVTITANIFYLIVLDSQKCNILHHSATKTFFRLSSHPERIQQSASCSKNRKQDLLSWLWYFTVLCCKCVGLFNFPFYLDNKPSLCGTFIISSLTGTLCHYVACSSITGWCCRN